MDFIISFFRNIDGPLYYSILVVNTILIFAIIGYLGEKNNEQMMKFGMNTNMDMSKNGALNLNTKPVQPVKEVASIPKVAATAVPNPLNQNVAVNNQTVQQPINNQIPNQSVIVQPKPMPVPTPVAPQPVNMSQPVQANVVTPTVNGAVPLQNFNNVQQTPVNNAINPNEKAPAVLIINSNNNPKI